MGKRQAPELPLPSDEAVKLEVEYVILKVEEFESELNRYEGWRVTLDAGGGEMIAVPLWYGKTVSRESKLGAFLVALGNDYDAWIGKGIKFISWVEKARLIEVVTKK